MVDWKQRSAKKLRISSISSYLLRIDKRLTAILEGADPVCFDEFALEAMYSEVLSGLPEQSISRVLSGLRKFHEFLVSDFGVPQEVGDVFDGYASGSSIDANILSEKDFRLAFERLSSRETGQPAWLAKMQEVVMILGYRTLLRRGEVHRLRMGDLMDNQCGVIYVRSSDAGVVKSNSAIRNIAFEGNLPADEALVLTEFVKVRFGQITGMGPDDLMNIPQAMRKKIWDTPLFQDPKTGVVVPIYTLFGQITSVLHEVTGNEQTHFHLARKGGINWKLLSLFEEEMPGCSLFLVPSGHAQRASHGLHRSLTGADGPDRRKVWCISLLAGHAYPAVTIGSYVTCLDWLLAYSLRADVPLPDSIVSAQTGRSETDIRGLRFRKGHERRDYFEYIKSGWISRVKLKTETHEQHNLKPPVTFSPSSTETKIDGVNMLKILNTAMANATEIKQLAIKNNITTSEIELWIKSTQKVLEGSDNRTCSSLTLPKPPSQKSEQKKLNHLTDLVNRFAKEEPHAALAWLNNMCINYSKRDNAVIYYDVEEAVPFHRTLQHIISGTDLKIGISLAPLIKNGSTSIDSQMQKWSDALNILVEDIDIEPDIARQSGNHAVGRLSIYLESDSKIESDKTNDNMIPMQEGIYKKKSWSKSRSGALVSAAFLASIGLCNPI